MSDFGCVGAGCATAALTPASARSTVLHWPPSSNRPGSPPTERHVSSGEVPPSRSDELEYEGRLAIEVLVVWRGDVLSATHVAAPAAVFVGDAGACDIALPAELVGAGRRCVAVSTSGDVCAVLPAGTHAWLTLPDGSTRSYGEPRAPLALDGSAEPAERLLPLPLGYRAHLCFADLEIQVATVRLGRPCRRVPRIDASLLAALGLSTLTVASAMAVLSRFAPAPGLNRDERAEIARLRVLRTYLTAASERTVEPRPDRRSDSARAAAARPRPRSPAPTESAPGDAELDTEPVAPVEATLALGTVATPAPDPVERRARVREAQRFGIIGLLDWPELNDPKYKYERHLGGEELALMQRLFNPDQKPLDDGPGGLNLSSTGIGGGGKANAIALGALRTADEGRGGGLDRSPGAALEPGAHTARGPSLQRPESVVSDPLAAASIRRAVHAERAALLACYSNAPGIPANAMGAMVRFVVRGDGQLEQVRATDPSLSEDVSRCIERVFLGLTVPNPVARPVHVAYRVALDS